MRNTPNALCISARVLLIVAAGLLVLSTLQSETMDQFGGPNIQLTMRLARGYVFTLLLFAAFPTCRRAELTAMVMAFLVLVDLPLAYCGLSAGLGALMEDWIGTVLAFIPGQIERLRHLSRTTPHKPFSEIKRDDRRRAQKFRPLLTSRERARA